MVTGTEWGKAETLKFEVGACVLRAHHMVDAEGIYAAKLYGICNGITNDSRSQVADVHVLGYIRGREVNYGTLIWQPRGPSCNALFPQPHVLVWT